MRATRQTSCPVLQQTGVYESYEADFMSSIIANRSLWELRGRLHVQYYSKQEFMRATRQTSCPVLQLTGVYESYEADLMSSITANRSL